MHSRAYSLILDLQAVEQSSAITEQLPTPWQISVQQQRPWSILDHLTWGNFHDIKVKLQLVGSGITEPHVLIDLVNEVCSMRNELL